MAGRAAFGEPVIDAARTYLGSAQGSMRGRDGNIHRGAPREGVPAMISHLGSMISVVNGMLMARRIKGTLGDSVGAACIGDGATSTGAVHEAINQAAVENLPLVIAVANNQFAYSTPNSSQFACDELEDRARGYGIEGTTVDGTDLTACVATFASAVARARAGEGPQLVVGNLLRLSGHGEHDDAAYVPDELRAGALGDDCLRKAKETAIANGWCDAAEIDALQSEATSDVDAAIDQAGREDGPDPYQNEWAALATARLKPSSDQDA
jgi:pyruvate dehydrogenase E1 component alpha subunit/2-oxoisovalerate dehydrogenase E1 component alpha subunit